MPSPRLLVRGLSWAFPPLDDSGRARACLKLLLSKLSVRERTLALLDAATGLRVSELLALRWSDVDFKNPELRVTYRSGIKSWATAKPRPLPNNGLAQVFYNDGRNGYIDSTGKFVCGPGKSKE
jgi:integrase